MMIGLFGVLFVLGIIIGGKVDFRRFRGSCWGSFVRLRG